MPAKKAKKKAREVRLEQLYAEFFRYAGPAVAPDSDSLEQPSPLKDVPSVTTYGAYEDPI